MTDEGDRSLIRKCCALSLALVTSFTPRLYAQPVCEVVKNDVDVFTDTHVLQITASSFSNGPTFEWLSVNGNICLKIHWTMPDDNPAVVFEGDTLLVKLENDTVLALLSKETTVGKPFTDEEGIRRTRAVYCYRVNYDQFALINQFWVQRMRLYFRDSQKEYEALYDPDWQMALWRSSNCLRSTLALAPSQPGIHAVDGPPPGHHPVHLNKK